MGCGGVSVLVFMWGSEFEVVCDGFVEAWGDLRCFDGPPVVPRG